MNADGCYLRLSAAEIISFSMFGELCTLVHFFLNMQESDSIEGGSG